jgi:hypothetical protein
MVVFRIKLDGIYVKPINYPYNPFDLYWFIVCGIMFYADTHV